MGHLGSDVLTRRQGRLPDAHLGQGNRRHRHGRGREVEEIRSARGDENQLDDARAEDRPQAERLCRRHGLVLSQRRRRESEHVLAEGGGPKEMGEIVFQRRAPHCWGPRAPELLEKMTKQIEKYAPAGADKTGWRYR